MRLWLFFERCNISGFVLVFSGLKVIRFSGKTKKSCKPQVASFKLSEVLTEASARSEILTDSVRAKSKGLRAKGKERKPVAVPVPVTRSRKPVATNKNNPTTMTTMTTSRKPILEILLRSYHTKAVSILTRWLAAPLLFVLSAIPGLKSAAICTISDIMCLH